MREARASVNFLSESQTLKSNASTTDKTIMSPIHSVQQLSKTENASSPKDAKLDPSTDDTFVVLLTLSVISITLYFSYYLWKRRRKTHLSISKLEDYRYSRLSQNEIDVDNMQFTNPISEDSMVDTADVEDNPGKNNGPTPATLHVEMDTTVMQRREKSNPTSILDELSDEQDLLQ